jgi:hypothetical protein
LQRLHAALALERHGALHGKLRDGQVAPITKLAFELLILAWLRWRFFEVGFIRALASVTLGGVIIASVSAALGSVG